jgi:hypothetical protein
VGASFGVLLGATLLLPAMGSVGLGVLAPAAPAALPISPLQLILLCAWAYLVALDERALGPLVFHEPLIAAVGAGLLCGHFAEGLLVGLLLQAIWPGLAPMAGAGQPAEGLAAVVGVGWYLALPRTLGAWPICVALAAAMVAAAWGARAELWLRARNERRENRLYADGSPIYARRLRAVVAQGAIEAGCPGPLGVVLLVGVPLLLLAVAGGLGLPVWRGVGNAVSLPNPAAGGLSDEAWRTAAPFLLFALGGLGRKRAAACLGLVRGLSGGGARRTSVALPGVEAPLSPGGLSPGGLLRLLLLQGSFSRRHLQRGGFLLALGMHRDVRHSDAQRSQQAALEAGIVAGKPVNTHPVMAAALIGAVKRIMHDAADGPLPRPPQRLLEVGGATLAQWGDRAIWGAFRPAVALLTLALLPLSPLWVAVVFVAGVLVLQIVGRMWLFSWGLRAGWLLARGSGGWLWRRGPAWVAGALAPLAAVAALVLGLWMNAGGSMEGARPFSSAVGPVWFILGVSLGGGVAGRALAWGWLCWVVGSLGAVATMVLA